MIDQNDLPHIRAAIEIARESRSEEGAPKPKVGVVLAKNGAEIGRAYRGEVELGEHGEFGVLERKLRDDNVAGATLYTTLEPCTKRSETKVPCAERIVERRISRVVIGILDPDQEICGRGIRLLRDAGITVDLFPQEEMAQVEEQNRDFIRDQERLTNLRKEVPIIGLTLESVELEPAPQYHYKFKLRLYWKNDGTEVHLGEPRWIAGGVDIQGTVTGYRYQLAKGAGWGEECKQIEVPPNQRVRVYVGLDSRSADLAPKLLAKGRLGTLELPVTPKHGRLIKLHVRPRSPLFHPDEAPSSK
jgi:pyrimidine deaminase RibD-like protein